MRRCLITIAIFLAAGAVVNVAVAWGVVKAKDWKTLFPITEHRESGWPRTVPAHWPEVPQLGEQRSFGVLVRSYSARGDVLKDLIKLHGQEGGGALSRALETADLSVELFGISVCSAGWPMSSLQWELWKEWVVNVRDVDRMNPVLVRNQGHPKETWWLSGIPVELSTKDWGYGSQVRNRLPIRPVWPGFALNTLFYAIVLWLLICGVLALRRHIRFMRGFCPKCGYPMGESATCTECGRPLPGRAVA